MSAVAQQRVRVHFLAALLALTVASSVVAGGRLPVFSAPDDTPSLLPVAAESLIGAAVGRDSAAYHAVATAAGARLTNPVHGLAARFTSSGVAIRSNATLIRLDLSAYGHGARLVGAAPVRPTVRGNRVTYDRGAVEEWYVNGPLGIEQGFTLATAPASFGPGPLTLALRMNESANAKVTADGTALTFGSGSIRYRGLAAFDRGGRALHAWLELDRQTLLLRVDDAAAQYPITIDPFVQQAKLTASSGMANDALGFAVATNGSTIVVGASGVNGRIGAVYVFAQPGGGWANGSETAKLTASDGVSGDSLGVAVAIADDGTTIVAGARRTNSLQGAVYVFTRPGATWSSTTQTARLTASDGVAGDKLGNSVAIDGDTIVAGAPGKSSSIGAAYVFAEPAGGWATGTQTAKLTASDGAAGDEFGYSADISANTIAVGARYKANFTGALYVYVKPGAVWGNATETAKLVGASAVQYDELGQAVAIDGDTIVGGVPGKNSFAGAVYVFVKPAAGWTAATPTAQLTASDGATNDQLGFAVAISAQTVVGGAFHTSNVTGATYVFAQPANGWVNATQTAKLVATDAAAGDNFGYSVAVAGGTVAVGAVGKASFTGAAYVFGDDGQAPPAPTISSFAPTSGGVGTSVTISGTNFTGVSAVTFGGTSASFSVPASTQIIATVPAGAATGQISVTTGGGSATSAASFTVVGSPTISGFTPTSGGAGTSVTITGTNFNGATSVKFHGVSASFAVDSGTQITATVPSGATTGTISVTTPGGTATSSASFTVPTIVPTITGFTPTSGRAGTSVTITGTNFSGVSAVKFNGRSAKFTVSSSTQIAATVPKRASTGPISVSTSGGTAVSSTSFTVTK